ncbi:gliding motility protein GldM [Dysgonomonas sp. 520]|uniref:type IX secretion system motor protein PorM/GldM n=1 Tax=Dysgonomonas sp. 520 TaxID=2302931 RepID=UPI0013D40084|nr:gliding motility protein GldM [Dysgonomonas sp. 520]NDW08398.1 gliding motility protein GldM [Dysgonomonas sp. 520]
MAANSPNSPRQKMINLMYLIFIAMMALNVSSEVLEGFELVENGLQQTISSTENQNNLILGKLEESYQQNPVKAMMWYNSANQFAKESDSLFSRIQDLKEKIVKYADGVDGDVRNIDNKESVDAAYQIMLSKDQRGTKLKEALITYRENAGKLVSDSKLRTSIIERLNTEPSKKAKENNMNWEQSMFDQMPTAAAITLLTRIQSDIRAVQGEVLNDLWSNIGGDDYRVNSLTAAVIPRSMIVMQGSSYEGEILLAAVDTTKRPKIYIGNTILPESNQGKFQIGAGAAGTNKTFAGHIEWERAGKDPLKIPFSSTYSVIEPMATVASMRMNVLYAGINNELSISVPGVTSDKIQASVANGNGTVTATNKSWNARPSKVGQDMIVSVTAEMNGKRMEVAKHTFKVRALPDPTPYIEYADKDGNPKMFKGGRINKADVLSVPGIKAGVDDGILNIPFTVTGFTIVFFDNMGNGIREVSDGANFSDRQKEQIRRLQRGRSFFISDVKAIGPDGIQRNDVAAIEVRVN